MTSQVSSPPVAERALLGAGAAALVLYLLLGWYVSSRPPAPLDAAAAAALTGRGGDLLAWTLTESGFFQTFAALLVLQLAGALLGRNRRYGRRALFSAGTLIAIWLISDALKVLFARPRPEVWLVRHETSYSYSSGHATLAIAYWVLWAVFMWHSDLPQPLRRAGTIALVAFAVAVGWSRIELGAHYLSDVIGGYLLGLAWLACALVAARRLRLAV